VSSGAGPSDPETIQTGNVKITIQQNKNDMAILIAKDEKNKQQNKKETAINTSKDEKNKPSKKK